MANLTIYRDLQGTETTMATVTIDDRTTYTHKVLEVETIEAHFIVGAAIPIKIGDYIKFNNAKFYLNILPSIKKTATKTNKYVATFHSVLYDLNTKLFISTDGLAEFAETGTVNHFLKLIAARMNTTATGWMVGTVDTSADINISFVNETCLEALNKVATEFQFEFSLVGKTINFRKVIGTPRNITFSYGRNNGLYNIERKQVDSKAVYTRVYGFGGTRNIPFNYRDRAKRLVFEERFLEQNVSIFGVREAQFTDDTIYPQRTATITAVNTVFNATVFNQTESYVEDTSLDFDINDYLLEGQSAKIVFKSGDLSGVEFEIWKADFTTKRIYFKAFQDTDDYTLPTTVKQPRVGDSYTLVDLKMPPSYVITAEEKLKKATQVFLDTNAVPKTLYIVEIDPKFTKANAIKLSAGDLVMVVDETLGINRSIRIQELSYPLVNPFKIKALIADFVPYELQDFVNKTGLKNTKIFKNLFSKIENVTTIQKTISNTTNNVTNNFATEESGVVIINQRKYNFVKAFDNTINTTILETGDIIYGNWWNRFLYVTGWKYLGGEKTLLENWQQANTIDFTPY